VDHCRLSRQASLISDGMAQGVRLYCRAMMLAAASKGLEGLAVAAGSHITIGGKCRGR